MGVKWTPDNDQLLLLKILETHDVHLDTKKISAAWPSDKGEVPTARAITERLVKIRKDAKNAGSGHFGISSSQSKGVGTPRKDASKSSTPRKQNKRTPEDDEEGEESPSKRNRTASVQIKTEQSIETDDCMMTGATPKPQPRPQPVFRTPSSVPTQAAPIRQSSQSNSSRVPTAAPTFPQPSSFLPQHSPSRNTWLDGASDSFPRSCASQVSAPMRNLSVAPNANTSFGGSSAPRLSVPAQSRPSVPPQTRPSMPPQPKLSVKQESWPGATNASAQSHTNGYDSASDYGEEEAV